MIATARVKTTVLPKLNLPATAGLLYQACDAIQALLDSAASWTGDPDATAVLDAITWTYGRGGPLLADLDRVLSLSPAQRTQLADAFRKDRNFPAFYNNRGFTFAFRDLDEQTAAAAKDLLKRMYGACVKTAELEQQFLRANPDLSVCPYCLITALIPRTEDGAFLEADHVLPQATYPHLSAHPDNLVMVCANCNGFKRGKDPLVENGTLLSLPQTYLPYTRSAIGEFQLEFPVTEPEQPCVRLKGTTKSAVARIRTLNRLLPLERLWRGHLATNHKVLIDRLARDHGPNPNEDAVKATLLEHADNSHRATVHAPISMVDRDWARWLADEGLETVLDEIRRRHTELATPAPGRTPHRLELP